MEAAVVEVPMVRVVDEGRCVLVGGAAVVVVGPGAVGTSVDVIIEVRPRPAVHESVACSVGSTVCVA